VDAAALRSFISQISPDVIDLHEEPVSSVAAQWLSAVPEDARVCMYTAQNLDKRFPPPFSRRERQSLARADALYPCSRQAAAVARGKGYTGHISVMPLGFDDSLLYPGDQDIADDLITMVLVGRLVPEKGVVDAVDALAEVRRHRASRLVVVGEGPEIAAARARASQLGISDSREIRPWMSGPELSAVYRSAHVVLVPSRSTMRWVEQFGRVIVEGHAAGAVVAGYASGSIPEVVADAGCLVPEGDVRALAAAVAEVVTAPGRWQALRSAGFALAGQRTWERVANDMVRMYEHAVAQPSRRGRRLPSASAETRMRAAAEFGPPADADGVMRPFALPVLRDSKKSSALLGSAMDGVMSVAARIGR
jgi:glycosyltransferase involved in cell wall biosynthesis